MTGIDIADYTNIHAQYGNLDDFREFLNQAHERGLRVITELVVNHTSDQHPWFQRARRSPREAPSAISTSGATPPKSMPTHASFFKELRNVELDLRSCGPRLLLASLLFPSADLNFDNPAVWEALLPVVDFWFQMGVDGMRLDAVLICSNGRGRTAKTWPTRINS